MINFYMIDPFYAVNPQKHAKRGFGPRISPPKTGFYGTVTKVRTKDMVGGVNTYLFELSKEERRDLNVETLFFRAQDSQGILEIQSVFAQGQHYLVTFKRYTDTKAKIRGEGVFTPRYRY